MSKKIMMIVGYCLLGVIAISILVFALIPASNFPEISKNPNTVVLKSNSHSYTLIKENNQATIDEIFNITEKGFQENYLTAFFTGKLKRNSVSADNGSFNTSNDHIKFHYETEQTLMQNGKPVKKLNNDTENITYNDIYFETSDVDVIADVIVYFHNTSTNTYYTIKYWANLHELDAYLTNYGA